MSAPVDVLARRRALDPTGSFIVQAPAGSGKTELLTRRFLVLLGGVERPEEILAITFTRKAAGEMRGRILGALARARRGEAPESAYEAETLRLAARALERSDALGWALEENPARLQIRTIDSFLASVVGRMPWLSRLGAPPAIADRPEDLYEQAAREVLAHLDRDDAYGQALARVLAHLDNNAAGLRGLLVDLLRRRDQWVRHRAGIGDLPAVRPELERGLAAAVERGLARARSACEPWGEEIAALGAYAAGNVEPDHPLAPLAGGASLPEPAPGALPRWRAVAHLLLTGKGEWRRRGGINKNLGFPAGPGAPAAMKARLGDLLESFEGDDRAREALQGVRQLPEPAYDDAQWETLAALVQVVDLALARLWVAMGRQRAADFTEIALRALQALGDAAGPSDLLLALDRRLSHILVDEFQDTSFLQFHLLERLTEGWTPGDGRTLFLVGDPMQSIYRFREAEVGLFLRAAAHGIGTVPLEPLRLESNFRCQRPVVEWANRAFVRVFPSEADPVSGAVPFHRSAPVHEGDGPGVEVRASHRHDPEAEAQEVGREAARALEDGDVAVLARARTHLARILRAFDAAGLPYRGQDLDPLAARPAVRDVVSLTRALLHPGDRLAWLAVLRAPWCGLTLEDLHTVADDRSRPLPAAVAEGGWRGRLSPDGAARLERAWEALGPAVAGARRRRVRAWVEGTWTALGAPAYLSDQELADVQLVFERIDRLDRGGEIRPPSALEKALEGLYAAPDPGEDCRLHVLTIHKAKGLEFDTVLLPGLGRPPRRPENQLLYWTETAGGELLLAPLAPRVAGARDPIAEHVKALEKEKERRERARLLYVAVTRARRRAVLWGHARPDPRGEPRPASGSLLESLWPAVAAEFAGLPEQEPAEAAPPAPARTAVLRLPLGWRRPAPAAAVVPAPERPREREEPAVDPEFLWVGETARQVGTVTHRLLERIAAEGLDRWDARRVEASRAAVGAQLATLGVGRRELEDAVGRVLEAVTRTLEDPRGREVLGVRRQARSELDLTGRAGQGRVRGVVDRTYVDEEGTRWIVDFKTSTHEGGGREAFLEQEVERYRPQLATYARLLRSLEPGRSVRAALYYPLLGAWREVDV
ncbi:MAG: UvrD-helicase domain-containing protein [Deferrisomatales bacterium]